MEAVEVYDAKAIEPTQDIEQGTKAADALVKLVKKAGLAKKFGGEKEHLFVEAWEALGKFYRMSAKPMDAIPVTVKGIAGAKARAVIIDIDTGHEISGADAYCMRDEPNWRNRPFYQLASMVQTRAASKAFRMVLAFVPALAGFATTPAEEMSDMERVEPEKEEVKEKPKEYVKQLLIDGLSDYCTMKNGEFDTAMADGILKEISMTTKGKFFNWESLNKMDENKYPVWFQNTYTRWNERNKE